MTSESENVIIEEAPASFKSFVWQYFGFPLDIINGNRVTDKTRTICKLCQKRMPYTAANTSTMQRHIQNHHSWLLKSPAKKTTTGKCQATLAGSRAEAITRDIGVFIAADMRPFSVVENKGFRRLLHTLEPKYTIPPRTYFTSTVVPNLYKETKTVVVQTLKEAESIAITTDSWTLRGTQNYITITAHTINNAWEMKSVVLQTDSLFESHTGANLSEVLQAAVTDWELERTNRSIAIVTDDARNMEAAVREAGLEPHIKCFAHTINLATQAGLGVPRVTRLLGRVRRVAAFFHRSSTATAVFMSKQLQLQLPSHKLIMDVTTRWISTLEMLARYLEQQAAIAAALASPEIRQNIRYLDTLDSCDIRDAEDLVKLLYPLKTATTVLCEEKRPTVSLIAPLKSMIEQSMTPNDGDSTTVSDTKTAILRNIADRYSGDAYNYLLECTALDPRFRTLPQLDSDQCEAVFLRVQNKAKQLQQNQTTAWERAEEAAGGAHCHAYGREDAVKTEPEVTEPAPKKTALEDLLGNSFSSDPEQYNRLERAEREMQNYRKEPSIPLSSCPLKWWRENCGQYPLLSYLAKACLSVPATCVPSERIFSTAGDTVSAQRSQLLPENVNMLIFLKKNMVVS
ncbi:E3 SUMO-protein ligase ZBED1-like [Dunckerocampus dactyliophorus]|uniref:E3 SUMO-protein ligase ZBED1-like n=1 Tax=Dunckerocampus dactyliophorus TaxID=161453 RepID=UPI002405A0B8|nr:E3 SUMO-protein ligase ZBED1-like [Dunckerocampus dactyliophorus]